MLFSTIKPSLYWSQPFSANGWPTIFLWKKKKKKKKRRRRRTRRKEEEQREEDDEELKKQNSKEKKKKQSLFSITEDSIEKYWKCELKTNAI